MTEEYVDLELNLDELKAEHDNRELRRGYTDDFDPDDREVSHLLRGDDDGMADEHSS